MICLSTGSTTTVLVSSIATVMKDVIATMSTTRFTYEAKTAKLSRIQ